MGVGKVPGTDWVLGDGCCMKYEAIEVRWWSFSGKFNQVCYRANSSHIPSIWQPSQFIHYASKNKWKAWIFDAFAFWLHLHDLLITIFGIKCITHAEQSAVCIHTHWREYWRCSVNPITKVLWLVDDVIWCFHICGNFINGHIVGWFKSVL